MSKEKIRDYSGMREIGPADEEYTFVQEELIRAINDIEKSIQKKNKNMFVGFSLPMNSLIVEIKVYRGVG